MDFLAKGFFSRKEKKDEEKFGQFFEKSGADAEEEKLRDFYPPEPGEDSGEIHVGESDLQITDLELEQDKQPLGYWEKTSLHDQAAASHEKPDDLGIPMIDFPSKQRFSDAPRAANYDKPSFSKAAPRQDSYAPLFVKVDRYNEIISKLQETKDLLRGVKAAFPLLLEIDQVKKEATESLRINIQKIEKNIAELDSELMRPGQAKLECPRPVPTHIEDSLSQLQSQLSSLRGQLEKAR